MGRSLTNTMVNLGIQSAVDEALYQVCIEEVAGGLQRLIQRTVHHSFGLVKYTVELVGLANGRFSFFFYDIIFCEKFETFMIYNKIINCGYGYS